MERLFNMCRSHGIELWDIKRDETSFAVYGSGKTLAECIR